MKLLAKTAEERCQTASGLEVDLRRCLGEWEKHGRIDPFPLGTHDAPDRLLIPEKLYGREREIDALLAAFDRVVVHGTPELVLVSGYSGVGKSSVVNELLAAVMNNAFFGDGQAKDDLGEMPSVGRRDTVPCRHSGESEKCGQPACDAPSGWTAT